MKMTTYNKLISIILPHSSHQKKIESTKNTQEWIDFKPTPAQITIFNVKAVPVMTNPQRTLTIQMTPEFAFSLMLTKRLSVLLSSTDFTATAGNF